MNWIASGLSCSSGPWLLNQHVVKLWNVLLRAVVCDKCLTWSGVDWTSCERELRWDLQ